MKINFYAHASFRLEADGLAVVTDPYTPGPKPGSGFDPIDEPADLVIMSSSTDTFHSDPSHVRGTPTVIDAMELPPEGRTVMGVEIRPFPAMESLTYDFQGQFGRHPDANALYLFKLGGLRVLHLGDTGNPVPPEHLAALNGQVDVLLALAGAHATIALDDLEAAIREIGPRVVIPMHYFHPRGWLQIEPVEALLSRYPAEMVTRVGGPVLEITPETLPARPHIYVLEQSR
ncbi:MBL fold metallo-hydrolase [Deinococcus altitudinis]|uniref:MBL fold metallo-hydrolase n=1 Tax=Deinococcus altitudinis TaxID=468914 RepID=UPI0038914569